MTTKKLIKKALAQALRNLARDYERGEAQSFTCGAVGRRIGADIRTRYAAVFEFDGDWFRGSNEDILWTTMHEDEMTDCRITLLCMAAAMAETGDL
jgi:hypothetical protein